ncbi:CGNR zinc finger domain-containing protein [Actinoplanes sp. NEAU-A12]|uniref:CGNR zinc finger domain-containing protein n=1 Tax=Actinoplanes sandaracinus TaxID=3045177 RepID=A0ABT6WGY2_9ACTN|nr:CGNR zinc finger domain-containing protein [Actinoplanes sandaracinus]MDI6098982.1 CGNR zinc finger domain-containing protein [Actinoplanes sandaracinus]
MSSPLVPPPGTALVLDFVNTRADGGGAVERLGDAQALACWLQAAGLIEPHVVVTAADAASARELRDALVTVMLAHSGAGEGRGDALTAAESHLRRTASLHPLAAVITAEGAVLASDQAGVPGAFGSILAAVADAAATDRWGRLKACRNPPCHHGFFDRTRNASGAYCSPGCGSQVSMRALRRRRMTG